MIDEFQIEKRYINHGICDCVLESCNDILMVHNVDVKNISGYNSLDDLKKKAYEKFIIKFYNARSLEGRENLRPLGIYFVREDEKLGKLDNGDDYYVTIERIITSINNEGYSEILHRFKDEEYAELDVLEVESKNYLRFEYLCQGSIEWQHVIDNGNTWY